MLPKSSCCCSPLLLLWLAGGGGKAEGKRFQPFQFDASTGHPLLVEQFLGDGSGLKWMGSEALKRPSSPKSDAEQRPPLRYSKDWAIEEAIVYAGFEGDKGLVLGTPDRYYAISAALPKPITFGRTPFILQFEAKFQRGPKCDGAYVKLFRAPLDAPTPFVFRPERVDDQSPFSLMFGPDRCDSDKVHLIIQHLNRRTGRVQEKHLKEPPMIRSTKLTSLYTLVVRPDGSFEIRINREVVRTGHLHTDFDPPLNSPAEIDDPEDAKPDYWVDEEKISDPTAVKPIDWDEELPPFVEDREARKPDGWLEDEPEMIPDPGARRPAIWNEGEDGVWEAPLIINPKCRVGCGKWVAPLKKNPLYKGRWSPPLIDNPAYRGPWRPRQIPNPEAFTDETPAAFLPAVGIGFELYTMQGGVLIDNILITSDEEQALQFAEATWTPKYDIERLALEAELQAQGISDEPPLHEREDGEGEDEWEPQVKPAAKTGPIGRLARFSRDLTRVMRDNYVEYWEELQRDPRSAIIEYPAMTANMALMSLAFAYLLWAMTFFLLSRTGRGPQRGEDGKKAAAAAAAAKHPATIQSIVKSQPAADIASMTLTSPQQEATGPRMRRTPSQIPRPVSPIRPLKPVE